MVVETVGGTGFINRTRAAINSERMNGNAAARGKFAEDFNIFRLHQTDKIFHDDIDAIFMKVAVIAEAE